MLLSKPLTNLLLSSLLLGVTCLPQTLTAQTAGSTLATTGADAAKPYTLVEQMPQFEGGNQEMLKFISSNIRYPREAIMKGIQGTTYVSFVIQSDGSLSQTEAHQKLGYGIEEEALRVIQLTAGKWTPGKQDGKAVAVRFTLPLKFNLLDDVPQGINQPLTDSLNNVKPHSDPRVTRYINRKPRYMGGRDAMQKFVGENLKYPESAKEGIVVVSFILDEKGQVSHPTIKKSISPELDAEAMRVVQLMSGKWEPAMHENKLLKVGYYLPIRIKQTGGPKAAASVPSPDNTLYVAADQMPEYIGGHEGFYKTISNKLILPADLRQKKLNARLEVQFVVEKNGTLSDIRITDTRFVKTISPDAEFNYMDASKLGLVTKAQQAQLIEATVAAIKATSGQWTPGIRNEQEARVQVTMPVSFRGSTKAVPEEPAMKTVTILKPTAAAKPATAAQKQNQEKKFTHHVFYSEQPDRAPDAFVMPTFKGGEHKAFILFLMQQVRYPASTMAEGDTKASFRINKDGSLDLDNITITPHLDPALEQEIKRVISLMQGSWKAGTTNGEPTAINMNINFSFVLKDKLTQPKPPFRGTIIVEKLR